MLQLSQTIASVPVLSLRTGQPVAMTFRPIINPNNLKIEGFYCQDSKSRHVLVLLAQDIREDAAQGFLINDYDVLSDPDELVRLKDVIKTNFTLHEKLVVTDTKRKLGKVTDYAYDSSTFYIQKLYVGQSLIRSFSGGQLSVDRNRIVEITNKKIVVQDPQQGIKAGATAPINYQ